MARIAPARRPTARRAPRRRRSPAPARRRRAAPSPSRARRRASRGCRARPTARGSRASSRATSRTRARPRPSARRVHVVAEQQVQVGVERQHPVDDRAPPAPACMWPMPACRSATSATRSPSRPGGQPGSASPTSGVHERARLVPRRPVPQRGGGRPAGRAAAPMPAPAARAAVTSCRRPEPDDVDVPADVVEPAAGRPAAEPGADLLELRGVERRAEPAEALAVVEAQLGGELVALQQARRRRCRGERLGRLDLDRAVALEPGRGRDQLADDHVLLQARRGGRSCPRAPRR